MAKLFLSGIDAAGIPLLRLRLENLATAPTGALVLAGYKYLTPWLAPRCSMTARSSATRVPAPIIPAHSLRPRSPISRRRFERTVWIVRDPCGEHSYGRIYAYGTSFADWGWPSR